jgi:hypothetical protein
VVKAEGKEVLGSNLLLRKLFFMHHSNEWHGTKEIMERSNQPGIVACGVILLMGGFGLFKSSFTI